ncbi:transcriptional repressor of dcmA and dcmR [Nitrosomonas cryotolerans]|uniref:Transcriptional repressor of dcmA and dcmR n=1 Tax=Nitrosomonas cryotolerans ATCC 49181 TaxID=1131553 RepID=A0A1N6I9D2_9PROT|nr:MEDS domain-containing protein [Nitrosomonas cryotolerans]SFP83521.1 transcriptional repressor of dcmA and dcmR [Nitrosomonas cryotolerans]SIO28626.1 transcriptional repressor of dcmA and dcmR [Nitrosomonas cryotolerans ATCC 49181]
MSTTENVTESLLNIKQAAKILNASEISLRRWSDSGKLTCLRIGVKRERRYRLTDLRAYLEQDQVPANMVPFEHAPSRIAHIDLEGITINYGSHLCAFYDTDLGRLKLALPFLLGGLQAGNRCFVVATAEVQSIILNELRDVRSDIDQDVENGHIVLTEGMADSTALYTFFENAFMNANKQGIQGLRVLGDMAWTLQKGMGTDELNDFETRYNQGLGHHFPVVSLCQYDARLFSGIAILGALKCHGDTFHYPLAHFLGV